MRLQETDNFGLSTLHTGGQSPKAVALQNTYMAIFVDQGDGFSKEVWGSDGIGNPNYGREALDLFFIKIKKLTRSWPLDWRDRFGHGINWDGPSSFGLWTWPLQASHARTMVVQVKRL
jgi:hypothetical protein